MKGSNSLQTRLIDFTVDVLDIIDELPVNFVTKHLGSQLFRSVSSIALNYAESQAAESSKDFIHKQMICLKEAREAQVTLYIFSKRNYIPKKRWDSVLDESGQIVAMLTASVTKMKKKASNS